MRRKAVGSSAISSLALRFTLFTLNILEKFIKNTNKFK